MLSVNQGMSPSSPESSLLSTAAILMKSTREGHGPKFDVFANLNQFSPNSSPDMHSVWKSIFQRASGNMATDANSSSSSNDFSSDNLHRTPFSLPCGLKKLALTAPLLMQPTMNVQPDQFTVSQSEHTGVPMTGHTSPTENPFLPYSPTPSGYPAVPTPPSIHPVVSTTSHDTFYSEPGTAVDTMTTVPTSGPTVAAIPNITSAPSSNSYAVGGTQFLAACTPLLQLAVRKVLVDCLSACGQVSIQGLLEVKVNGMANSQSQVNAGATTILKFNDEVPGSNQNEQINYPAINSSDNLDQSKSENGGMVVDSEARRSSTTSQSSTGSSSRRKPLNPSRCSTITVNSSLSYGDLVTTINSLTKTQPSFTHTNGLNPTLSSPPLPISSLPLMSNGCSNSPPLVTQSGPTSPSADSGVLDLSRAGSLADSAPITPMKDLSISTEASVPLSFLSEVTKTCTGHNTILEAYQKQIETLNQFQAIWSKVVPAGLQQMNMHKTDDSCSVTPTNGYSNDRLALNLYQLAQHLQQAQQQPVPSVNLQHNLSQSLLSNNTTSPSSPPFGQKWINRTISAPNSPAAKGIRRQRIPTSVTRANTGRMSVVRRSTSSRRFPCNQCREEFPSLHTLEEHTVLKHGTYRCHICKAQFTQRSNLQRHALKHVGFKPFECRVCSKAYYRKDHLMRHMEMGHPGYTPRENITVHLTSSESLEFLNRTCSSGAVFSTGSSTFADTTETKMDHSVLGLDTGVIEDGLVDDTEIKLDSLPLEQECLTTDDNVLIETTVNDTIIGHYSGSEDTPDQLTSDECHLAQNVDPESLSCHYETDTKGE